MGDGVCAGVCVRGVGDGLGRGVGDGLGKGVGGVGDCVGRGVCVGGSVAVAAGVFVGVGVRKRMVVAVAVGDELAAVTGFDGGVVEVEVVDCGTGVPLIRAVATLQRSSEGA